MLTGNPVLVRKYMLELDLVVKTLWALTWLWTFYTWRIFPDHVLWFVWKLVVHIFWCAIWVLILSVAFTLDFSWIRCIWRMILVLLRIYFELQLLQSFCLRQKWKVQQKPKFKIINEAFYHRNFPFARLGQKNFRLVDKNIGIYPNEEIFLNNSFENHVLIKHKMTIKRHKFMASLDNQASIVKRKLIWVKLSKLLNCAVSVFLVPNFLNVI